MILSPQAEQVIATAKECFSLQMIDQRQLENIVRRASTEVDYPERESICDLPLPWEIENTRALWRKAEKQKRRAALIARAKRLVLR